MSVALDSIPWQTVYPMDYYSNDSLGAWTNNNEAHRPVRQRKPRPVIGSKGDKHVSKGDNKDDKGEKQVSKGENSKDTVCKENNLVSEKDNKLTECLCKNSELDVNLANNVSKEEGLAKELQLKSDTNSCCDRSSVDGCCSTSNS